MRKIYFLLFAFLFSVVSFAQIINFPDANFKAKLLQANPTNFIAINNFDTPISIDLNGDGQIEVSEALNVKSLSLDEGNNYAQISSLVGINYFTNLKNLACGFGILQSLDLTGLVNLEILYCDNNNLSSLNVTGLNNLQTIQCQYNNLSNLDISQNNSLVDLQCEINFLSNLDISQTPSLEGLYCQGNQIVNLNVTQNPNLYSLDCNGNSISNLNVTQNPNLHLLNCSGNNLNNLNISQNINLERLDFHSNEISNINISQNTFLTFLNCSDNNLTTLNVLAQTNLVDLYCSSNQFITLNLSSNTSLKNLYCVNNQLESLFLKNSNLSWDLLNFTLNPNLHYICADEEDILLFQSKIDTYGYTSTCQVNSYCSFNPGGNFYTIQGNNRLDADNNGCDINDINFPNLKFNISSGTTSGTLISNSQGNYSIPVSAGTHTFSPQLENPTYFNVSPTTTTVTFPATASPFTQNFCVTPNGIHHDLEITIIPVTVARPGFDATYKIKYKNKGNQIENASVNLNFNQLVMDLVSSSVTPTSTNFSVLNWTIGNLNAFQQGEIIVTFNLNSPTESPALNAGTTLNFTSNITSPNTDETQIDNSSTLEQIVVNSFDPNDKRCLEGTSITSAMIGDYIHYMIRFENTGTFPAQNIVVKDLIDTSEFDVSSLQLTDASHTCFTRINGNKVEFIFENINLDFNDATNDGYVVFKIRTLTSLSINAQITNTANIYFDYNFPITTNTATSNFVVLKNNNFDFGTYFTIYPNPVKDILNITSKENVAISSITIYNILGQIVQTKIKPNIAIDVSELKTGNYLLKVTSDKGTSTTKFIKQ